MHSAAESQEPVQTWFSFTLIGVMDPPFPSGLEKQRVMEWFCSKCHKKTTAHKSHHNPLSLSQGERKTLLLHGKGEEMSKEAETIKPA